MSRLNPLYLLLLSVVLSVFSIYATYKEEKKLQDLQSEYRYKEDLALKTKALKNAYSPKRKNELMRLLRRSVVQKSGVKFTEKKDRLTITGKGADVKIANQIFSKIFNGTYNLSRFFLRKKEGGVDFEMEIRWR